MSKPKAKLVAELCRGLHEGGLLPEDQYSFGYVVGLIAGLDLKWPDVCGACKGCEKPIAAARGEDRSSPGFILTK